jgi:hypothetical protein
LPVCIAIMIATFMTGLRITQVPDSHLDEFRDAIAHGEILRMVETEESPTPIRAQRHQPEASTSSVGWGTETFGLSPLPLSLLLIIHI